MRSNHVIFPTSSRRRQAFNMSSLKTKRLFLCVVQVISVWSVFTPFFDADWFTRTGWTIITQTSRSRGRSILSPIKIIFRLVFFGSQLVRVVSHLPCIFPSSWQVSLRRLAEFGYKVQSTAHRQAGPRRCIVPSLASFFERSFSPLPPTHRPPFPRITMLCRSFFLLFLAAGTLARGHFGRQSTHPKLGRHRHHALNRLPSQDTEDVDDPGHGDNGTWTNTTSMIGASKDDTSASNTSTSSGASGPYKLDVRYTGQDFFK